MLKMIVQLPINHRINIVKELFTIGKTCLHKCGRFNKSTCDVAGDIIDIIFRK